MSVACLQASSKTSDGSPPAPARVRTRSLRIETSIPTNELTLGESIAVNGVCLTVTSFDATSWTADASVETLARTALGQLSVGDSVHLERAVAVGDRLGGHIVQGHVDGTGKLTKKTTEGRATHLRVRLEDHLLDEVVEKGSIAVDGVSLTVNDVQRNEVLLTIVPFTENKTLLTQYSPGHLVNIETDIIGKYVKRLLGMGDGRSRVGDLLVQYGYMAKE